MSQSQELNHNWPRSVPHLGLSQDHSLLHKTFITLQESIMRTENSGDFWRILKHTKRQMCGKSYEGKKQQRIFAILKDLQLTA